MFTQCINKAGKNNQELPSDSLINEVISAVITLDSLDEANLGCRQLFFSYVYYMPKWDRKSHIPPPPQPIPPHPYRLQYGFTYDEAFSYFNSLNDIKQRKKDSIFIISQSDTTIIHNISDTVSSLFKKKKDDFYWFSLPIFSYDKRTAIVAYSEEYYFGYLTVLKKVDDKWVKIENKSTWMR